MRVILSIFTIILLSFMVSPIWAGTDDQVYNDPNYHLTVTHNTLLFLPGSTGEQDQEESTIEFSLDFDVASPALGRYIGTIDVNITYDDELWTLIDVQYNDQVWGGDFTYNDQTDGMIHLLFDGEGSCLASTTELTFAELKFEAKCQPGYQPSGGHSDIIFENINDNVNEATVILASGMGSDTYYPDITNYVSLGANAYVANFGIGADVTGLMGEQTLVPIEYASGAYSFYLDSLVHYIVYDNDRLEVDDVIFNSNYYPSSLCSWSVVNDNTIKIVYSHSDSYNINKADVEDPAIYEILFDVLGYPDGDNDYLSVGFDNSVYTCQLSAYTDYGLCEELNNTILSMYVSDNIEIPAYTADFHIELADDYVEKGVNPTFNIQMENNFPAGDYTDQNNYGGIETVFDLPLYFLVGASAITDSDSLDFHGQTGINDGLLFRGYQEYNSGFPGNFWPPRESKETMYSLTLNWDESEFTPNYDDRFVDITWLESHDSWETYAEDITGSVTLTPGDGITCTYEPAEILMGHFSADNKTNSTGRSVTQDLYISANFDVGEFTVNVQITDNDGKISSVSPVSGVSYAWEDSYPHKNVQIYYDGTGAFCNATGDDSVKVASISYYVNCAAGKITSQTIPSHEYFVTISTAFSDAVIKDTEANSHFVHNDPGWAKGYCSWVSPDPYPGGEDPFKTTDMGLPTEFALLPNHPNPFNPTTTIQYELPYPCQVQIVVTNILGQNVTTLVNEFMPAGRHEIMWDGHDSNGIKVSSGIYLYTIKADNFVDTRKMVLMK